jgi:hypothetical protein
VGDYVRVVCSLGRFQPVSERASAPGGFVKKDKQDAYATLGDAPFSSHAVGQQHGSIGFQPVSERGFTLVKKVKQDAYATLGDAPFRLVRSGSNSVA